MSRIGLLAAALLLSHATPGRAGAVLDHIQATGSLACGVLTELDDFGKVDTHGALLAFGRDLCRAVAAAVVGNPEQARIKGYPDEQHGFAAIRSGDVDLLLGATPSLSAGPLYGAGFARPVFLDGQSFLVERRSGIAAVHDLAGRSVCFISGTEADAALTFVLGARGIAYRPFPFEEQGEMEAALVDGHCDAMTGDVSQLADARALFHARALDFAILPDPITLDPIAPAWPDRDPQWGRVVDAVVSMLIAAEQAQVTQAQALGLHAHPSAAARALIAGDRLGAQVLGLKPDWSLRAIAAVGNYGELFRRDLGDGSPLGLARGRNTPWDQGGLLIAQPLR